MQIAELLKLEARIKEQSRDNAGAETSGNVNEAEEQDADHPNMDLEALNCQGSPGSIIHLVPIGTVTGEEAKADEGAGQQRSSKRKKCGQTTTAGCQSNAVISAAKQSIRRPAAGAAIPPLPQGYVS